LTDAPWHLLVPGGLERLSGGTLYDRRMVDALAAAGRAVTVHGLPGTFPHPDTAAREGIAAALAAIPDGAVVIVDGLALGGAPQCYAPAARRLRLIALVHHPLADEGDVGGARRAALLTSEAEALALVAGVLTTSAFTARRLQALGLYDGPLAVAPPGTDPAPPAAGSGDGTPALLTVGALIPRKGQDVMVDALAQLTARRWQWLCVGRTDQDPAFAARVRDAVNGAGLADRVRLSGALTGTALAEAYHGADLFVLPSRYEGYGMVVTEALARGVPVVTTRGGALPETLPGDAGVLVPPGDAAALADTLGRLLDSRPARRELAAAAHRTRDALADWGSAGRRFNAAVAGLVGDD